MSAGLSDPDVPLPEQVARMLHVITLRDEDPDEAHVSYEDLDAFSRAALLAQADSFVALVLSAAEKVRVRPPDERRQDSSWIAGFYAALRSKASAIRRLGRET